MKNTDTQPQNKFGNWLKTSITARMFIIGFLTLILLIPLFFIQDLIRERSHRQTEVINEINEQWGNEVLIYGPILKVPYKTYNEKTVTDKKTKQVYTETNEEIQYAFFFPENLNINSNINPETKKRGIYTTAVYDSQITLTGSYTKPDFSDIEIDNKDILWDKAKIIIQSSNVKGVNEANLKLDERNYELTSKYNGKKNYNFNEVVLHTLETKTIDKTQLEFKKSLTFNINLNIKGSEQIRFIPTGKQTSAKITSNWKTANFFGEFLPYNDNKITENGFDAKWKILDLNRPFSQQHFNGIPDLKEFAFGVNFMIPVDEYQKSERSAKYGFLVIALTFLIFFLIQTLSKINIHPFQYLMIGLALTMFYTLLVSISEHSNFLKAYLIAGISVILLITLYSKSILKTFKFPVFIGLSLTALYTFIYVIIQLENYALIVGSIGLFLILTMIMYVSRKIDWNNG
ncbi:cell envelope integrity protein CreD [Mariniflexile litorale]|uniref:Cell envelope integrity protein CreD n=1 Tax=Mariniflexile litorale TaxID=3045158 RepID=A0AAU7ECH8_9FLAO|nr:cell envelope integrity protein CreD [Mariniflexile sp. KMM 9835]MDQ8210429.1 cell envelope integrity protein CreD [Mariniflexile sp. KMM 9835]